MSLDPRVDQLRATARGYDRALAAQMRAHPSPNARTFLVDYWEPFYHHFKHLSDPDVSTREMGIARELARLQAIAASNGVRLTDSGTTQSTQSTQSSGWPTHVRHHQGATTMYGPTPTFVGRCYAGATPAKYSLVNIAPVLAPGAGGMSVQLSIDGCHLVANVCIDGKCYKGAADLTGLVDFTSGVLDAALAHWHAKQHRSVDLAVPTPRGQRFLTSSSGWFSDIERGVEDAATGGAAELIRAAEKRKKGESLFGSLERGIEDTATLGAAEGVRAAEDALRKKGKKKPKHEVIHEHAQVIRATGEALVGAIAERHQRDFVAGWWHDLTRSISKDFHSIEHGVVGVLKQLKGPIIAAATAAATAFGVPPQISGPLASAVMDAATGSGSVAQAAKQTLAAATNNPALAPYVAQVKQAVAQSTVAAQAAQQVANAAAGSPAAMQQVSALASAATNGDPAAQQAMGLIQNMPGVSQQLQQIQPQLQQVAQQGTQAVTQAAQSFDPSQYAGDGSSDGSTSDGSDTSSSGTQDSPRAHAVALAQGLSANVVGVVCTADGRWTATPFASSDEADDWYGGWIGIPHAFLYVGYFDKTASWPYPENEQIARGATRSAGTSVGVGPFMPILFTPIEAGLAAILAAGAGYHYGQTRSAGWPAIALAAGGGFAAGHWGERAYDWAREKWAGHELAKAAKGAG